MIDNKKQKHQKSREPYVSFNDLSEHTKNALLQVYEKFRGNKYNYTGVVLPGSWIEMLQKANKLDDIIKEELMPYIFPYIFSEKTK